MCRPETLYRLKLSRTYSKLLRYRHHYLNFEFSEANACIPVGLRLKKTPCIRSNNPEFYDNWSRTLRQTEQHLVSLLKSEVNTIRESLNEEVNTILSEVTHTQGDEIAENLFCDILKENEELEKDLTHRRLRKWETLIPNEAHTVRPRISTEAITKMQNILTDVQNFNERQRHHPPEPNERNVDLEEDREETNQTREVRTDNQDSNFNSVFNLSSRILTSAETSVLSRGLNFCPTPKSIDYFRLKKDLVEFGRSLKCKLYFHDKSNAQSADTFSKFRKKSTWNPPVSEPALDLFLSQLEVRLLSMADEGGHNFSNLSSAERMALKNLKSDTDIVIKQADKGSAVVVLDLVDYKEEAYRQLNDLTVYESVESDPSLEVFSLICDKLKVLHDSNFIDAKCLEYLKDCKVNLGKFYLLPKIHKDAKRPPGRPIVSNCGMPTEKISEFLDFHLQPLVGKIPSYIQDTTDFLNKLKDIGDIPDQALLVTIDVVGLYSHIPHLEGLAALKKALDERDDFDIPTSELVDLARIVLENNYFEFDEKIFHQKLGTAMGTKFAPAFANIFMAELERCFIQSVPYKPWLWWRFLDDVFMIWTYGRALLDEFLAALNCFNETIKFTWSISDSSIAYLDVLVSLSEGSISTDLYCKPTDTHQYLDRRSCHPNYVKRAIPYSQALRIKRICSETSVFNARTREMKTWFKKKGYSEGFLDSQIARAASCSRSSALKRKQSSDNNRNCRPLVLDFHPSLSRANRIISDLYPILASTAVTREVFSSVPFVSFRRPKNLRDSLVRAKLPRPAECVGLKGMQPCGKSRCQICRFVSGLDTFQDSALKHTYFINYKFNCDSKGVIYLLSCKRCKKSYVGSTIDTFRRRFNNHKSSLNRYGKGQRDMPGEHLYAHFFSEDHEGLADLSVNIIDKTDVSNPTDREAYWTYRLDTFTPKGLNLRDFFM